MKIYAIRWNNKNTQPCYLTRKKKWEMLKNENDIMLFVNKTVATNYLFDYKVQDGYVVELDVVDSNARDSEAIVERVERSVDTQRRIVLSSMISISTNDNRFVMTTYKDGTIIIKRKVGENK